ncbi:MAG TPA: hypothetical protein VF077_08750, partial [Nitrospiraceae bacterium]
MEGIGVPFSQDYGGGPQVVNDLSKLSEMGVKAQHQEQENLLLPGRLRLQDTLAAQQSASALHNMAEYQKITTKLQHSELAGNLMKKLSQEGLDPTDAGFEASRVLMKAGLWEEGHDMYSKASIQSAHRAKEVENWLAAQKQQREEQKLQYQDFAARIGDVKDQDSFDAFNRYAAGQMEGKPLPWSQTYSPEVVERVRDQARTQHERDEVQNRIQERAARQKLADQAARARMVAAGIAANQRAATAAARQTTVYEPKASQLKVVERLVENDPESKGVTGEKEVG